MLKTLKGLALLTVMLLYVHPFFAVPQRLLMILIFSLMASSILFIKAHWLMDNVGQVCFRISAGLDVAGCLFGVFGQVLQWNSNILLLALIVIHIFSATIILADKTTFDFKYTRRIISVQLAFLLISRQPLDVFVISMACLVIGLLSLANRIADIKSQGATATSIMRDPFVALISLLTIAGGALMRVLISWKVWATLIALNLLWITCLSSKIRLAPRSKIGGRN